ncbi:MAG: Glu-tRNA(Gln) amidotransferase GatDE subunit E [Candidatus Nanohalarchaeota archaeon]|nr:MAG: Glu-tRNA(Gln) amidotransferase GatDE subunit E [Candidatus Nanohaloarchaeota archaeon]
MNKEKTLDYYRKIGLKCGLEIHKRLDTKKLFCNCSTNMCGKRCGSITRKMNLSVGEMGEADETAKKEVEKEKIFEYVCFEGETCLVDIDEEPPHSMNKEALDIVLDLCLKFDCCIFDNIYVMRKTVLDGSNTSGFQRTAIVGTDGKAYPLKEKNRAITIDSLCIEEESAQIEKDDGRKRTYLLNRLGIPLVEITTGAFFATPMEVKEIALYLGMFLNSTEKVKRGIGTIRQDVNISIKGGARVEIKGMQDVRQMDKMIELEIQRQLSLIEIKEKLKNKKIIIRDMFEATSFFSNTKSAIFAGKESYGISIKEFAGFFAKNLNNVRTLGNEIAKIACVGTNVKGIIHTDEDLKRYRLHDEFEQIRKQLKIGNDDLIICVATDKKKAVRVFEHLKARILMLKKGIPKETRACLPNNDSVYMRLIAGAKRMYPETDIPKMHISKEHLKNRKKNLFETYEERKELYTKKMNVTGEFANQLINLKMNRLFDEVLKSSSLKKAGNEVAKSVISHAEILEKMQTNHGIETTAKCFGECFAALKSNVITKQGAGIFLAEKLKNPDAESGRIIKERGIEKLDKKKLTELIEKAKRKSKTQNIKEIIRFIESSHKNQIDKKELIEVLRE